MTDTQFDNRPTLWLDLQPEYIDVNLDKFINYLFKKNEDGTSDDFYRSSVELLRNRVNQLCDNISKHPIGAMIDESIDRDESVRQVRIMALLGLVNRDDARIDLHQMLACMDLLMVRLVPEIDRDVLLDDAVRALTSVGRVLFKYSWNDVVNFEPYLFMQTLRRTELLPASGNTVKWFVGDGSAQLRDKQFSVYALSPREMSNVKMHDSVVVCDGRLRVCAQPSLRLSLSKSSDFDSLAQFFYNFLGSMTRKELSQRKLSRYSDDTDVLVRIVGKGTDWMQVATIDPSYERLSGSCVYTGRFRYNLNMFCKYLRVGQVINATIGTADGDNSQFDLMYPFWDFLFDCDKTEIGTSMVCELIGEQNGFSLWWSEFGFVVSVKKDDSFVLSNGMVARVTIVDKNYDRGFINGDIMGLLDDSFRVSQEVGYRRMVESFGSQYSDSGEVAEETCEVDDRFCRLLSRVLYVKQKYTNMPVERYRMLGVVQLISRLCGDNTSMHYADFGSRTLENMVRFACGRFDRIEVPEPDASIEDLPGVMRRTNIIYTLMQYNRECPDEQFLESMIAGDVPMLANLARLVQSGNRMAGVLSGSVQRQIELEITRQLRVDDESETDFNEADEDYFGVEDERKEFKSSFVFPPDNHMQVDTEAQRRNVFRGVCAMLNSREGGVIYLGVNDHGHVEGLQADMAALGLQTVDSYMRHVSDSAKRAFGLELMPYIHLEAMQNERVVAIRVEPCDFKIVELEGVAYVRVNAESRRMDNATRMVLLNRKLHFDASRARIEIAISTAMEHRCQAILQGYRPERSLDTVDCRVEPFAFTKGNKQVWAYDVDAGEVSLFSLSRIGDVRVEETPWTHQKDHHEGRIDLFRSTEGEPVRVQLMLDAVAYNLLVDECDGSEAELTNMKDGRYMLDTEVLGLEGLGRFYIGLAAHIDIVNAPGLREWAADYARRHLLG